MAQPTEKQSLAQTNDESTIEDSQKPMFMNSNLATAFTGMDQQGVIPLKEPPAISYTDIHTLKPIENNEDYSD